MTPQDLRRAYELSAIDRK